MKTSRWLLIIALLLALVLALPAAAQETETEANPLAGMWSFLGLNAELVDAAVEAAATPDNSLQELLAGLPQNRTEDGAFVVGELDAPFTLVLFADWACPHCITYDHETVFPFIETYVASGQAAFEFRAFPTAGGETTVAAAQLAECAESMQPGAFWSSFALYTQMVDAGAYSVQNLLSALAGRLEVTQDELIACVVDWDTNNEQQLQIYTDYAFATEAGISGTPAVLVRFAGGEAEVLEWNGESFNQGGVPLEILSEVVASVQES